MAVTLAQHFEAEIISADSRQFYKEMTIGTAKPTEEELSAVPHHFIDSHSIEDVFSAGEFGREAMEIIKTLHAKNRVVIAVGGSGLYLKALWEGFDEMPEVKPGIRADLNKQMEEEGLTPLLAELQEKDPNYFDEVDQQNGQRVIRALEVIRSSGKPFTFFRNNTKRDLPYQQLKIGLEMDREALFDRINQRMDSMIENGLFDEAKSLIDFKEHNALQTVGYTEIFDYLLGAYDKEEAVRLLKRNSRRYAKRQMTWFRRYEDIHWFQAGEQKKIIELITTSLSDA